MIFFPFPGNGAAAADNDEKNFPQKNQYVKIHKTAFSHSAYIFFLHLLSGWPKSIALSLNTVTMGTLKTSRYIDLKVATS